jgi:hypothetical protein
MKPKKQRYQFVRDAKVTETPCPACGRPSVNNLVCGNCRGINPTQPNATTVPTAAGKYTAGSKAAGHRKKKIRVARPLKPLPEPGSEETGTKHAGKLRIRLSGKGKGKRSR